MKGDTARATDTATVTKGPSRDEPDLVIDLAVRQDYEQPRYSARLRFPMSTVLDIDKSGGVRDSINAAIGGLVLLYRGDSDGTE